MSPAFPVVLEELREKLLANPALLEPGLVLQAHPLSLGGGIEVPLHGVDVLGHPCLVGFFARLDAEAYDWMLSVLVDFREGLAGGDPVYARGRQPRLFLLCPFYRPEDHARLRLLAEAGPIRALSFQRTSFEGDQEDVQWFIRLSFPQPAEGELQGWTEQAPQALQGYLSRLLAACRRGQASISVEGVPWPVLFLGPGGPFAALHKCDDQLLLVAQQELNELPQVYYLDQEDDRDRAIDRVLRERAVERASQVLQQS